MEESEMDENRGSRTSSDDESSDNSRSTSPSGSTLQQGQSVSFRGVG